MILNEDGVEKAKLAGQIAAKTILYGKTLVKPGEKLVDVLDAVEAYAIKQGAQLAFPAQLSLNNIAAHACSLADDPTVFKETDLIKLDLGVHIDGYIADNALTIVFEKNERFEELHRIQRASKEALANALKTIAPGVKLGEVGLIIQETIAKYDLSPIRNLSGHGLGHFAIHESPNIPNFHTHDKTELQENQHIAVEPFATNGHGMIYETTHATVFSAPVKRAAIRSQYARELHAELMSFNGLPFTTRWLTRKMSPAKVQLGLSELKKLGLIHEYPPLLETGHGLVAQSEHTVIVRDTPIVTTKRDDD